MSEPEAKQYLLEGTENCRKALSALDASGNADLAAQKKAIEEVVQLLEGLLEKVFLKTKKAVAPTFQVNETSQALLERAEDLAGGDDDTIRDFKESVGQLKDHVAALQAASKQQSVIVT